MSMLDILRQPSTPGLRAIGFMALAGLFAIVTAVALAFLAGLVGGQLDLMRAALASTLAGLIVASTWLLPHLAVSLWRLALRWTEEPDPAARREPTWDRAPA